VSAQLIDRADSSSGFDAAMHAPDSLEPDKNLVPLALDFDLPQELEASEPPEAHGLARDEVRLMISFRGDNRIEHARFREIGRYLQPGDLLVINTSGTLKRSDKRGAQQWG